MEIKKQIYIIISIFFLLVLFLLLFFVYPVFEAITQGSQDLITQKNNRVALESQFSEAEKFKQKYQNYQPNLEKIDSLFVDSQNTVKFIEFLEKIASDSNITLQISAPAFSKEENLSFAISQLSCSGSFSEILNFIKKLETGPYLIQIQNLDIGNRKAKSDQKQTDSIRADISIKAYSNSK